MNKVIIFGGDHYNALGLVRVFGWNNIRPYGILTADDKKNLFASKSKYWEKCWIVKNEEEGLKKIVELFSNECEKAVLVPSSDGAESVIDQNLDVLKENFYVPGIKEKQGAVSELMNKTKQIQWARSIGLQTAESWELVLTEEDCVEKIKYYPCILKPVLSSEGEKSDIVKCETREDAKREIRNLKKKGYKRLLAQEFLNKDYEMELFGCITQNSKACPYLLTKHVREWPPVDGSVSCHEFIVDSEYKKSAENILEKIRDYGYSGNIDIELFMIRGKLYLNEVNFRNSGDVYACFHNKVYYPLIWYLDIIGKSHAYLNTDYENTYYAMNETTDFRHVVFGNLGFKEWWKYYKKTADFAIRFSGDSRPTLLRYLYFIKCIFLKGKQQRKAGSRR